MSPAFQADSLLAEPPEEKNHYDIWVPGMDGRRVCISHCRLSHFEYQYFGIIATSYIIVCCNFCCHPYIQNRCLKNIYETES